MNTPSGVVGVFPGWRYNASNVQPVSGHDIAVTSWWKSAAPGSTTESLIEVFEGTFAALWQRSLRALGGVTLTAIVERVIYTAAEHYPLLASVEIDATGLRCEGLRSQVGLHHDELSAGARFVLLEFLTVLGDLTAEILTPALHAELSRDLVLDGRSPGPPVRPGRPPTLPPIPTDYDRLEALFEMQTVLALPTGIEEACEALLPIVARTLPIRAALVLDTSQELERALMWRAAHLAPAVLDEAREHARSTLAYLVRGAARPGGIAEQATDPRRFVTLPLVVRGDVFGVFEVECEGAHGFDEDDLRFVNVLVSQLAVALERRHLQLELEASRSEVERANRRLRDLQTIADAALGGATLDESLRAVLHVLRSMFETDAAAVLLASADGKTLRCRSSIGLDDPADREVLVGAGAAGRIAATGIPMVFDDLEDVDGVSPILRANGIRSLLGAPMRARDRLTGVVHVASRDRGVFAHDQLQLLVLAADRIATIIDNARLYEQALAAVQSRDAMMSIVSHDLKTPLTGIMLSLEVLDSDDPRFAKPISIVKRQLDVVMRLISDLRDVGSLEAGRLSIKARVEDAGALVRDALEGVQDAATRKSVRLATRLLARDVILDCDRIRILQVLTNLLSNAIKFTPAGGSITVSVAEADPGYARVSVVDTGSGIAEGDLPRVFDRFWQAARTAHLGNGLGLAIAKGIVEAHRGTISVESRVGDGTTFSFVLPTARRDAPAHGIGARVVFAED